MERERYFVLSDGDAPDQIVFTMEDAYRAQPTFIDVFDGNGHKLEAYMYDAQQDAYTTNF